MVTGGPGYLVLDQTVRTCGTSRRLSCGQVDVSNTNPVTFGYAYFQSDNADCPRNPAASGTGTCFDPFVVGDLAPSGTCVDP